MSQSEDLFPPALDSEHALRLVIQDWVKDGELTSAAFKTRSKTSSGYRAVSLFVKERLPNQNGNSLHVGSLASRGRMRLAVGAIRSLSHGFNLAMDGSAQPPLEEFSPAHAVLDGPTHSAGAAKALAVAFNRQGTWEKRPE